MCCEMDIQKGEDYMREDTHTPPDLRLQMEVLCRDQFSVLEQKLANFEVSLENLQAFWHAWNCAVAWGSEVWCE